MSLSHHPGYKPKEKCSCGAENARFDFVPDSIYGVSIQKSCCIHDHRFEVGGTLEDFNRANLEFLANMLTEINEGIVWWKPTFFARRRAMSYYEAVARCGHESFNFRDLEAINV